MTTTMRTAWRRCEDRTHWRIRSHIFLAAVRARAHTFFPNRGKDSQAFLELIAY